MRHWPFKVVQGRHNRPKFVVTVMGEEKELSPEQISAKILQKIKHSAMEKLGFNVRNCVVTVPAYFNDS